MWEGRPMHRGSLSHVRWGIGYIGIGQLDYRSGDRSLGHEGRKVQSRGCPHRPPDILASALGRAAYGFDLQWCALD
jgi:hypothetical protein